MSRDVVAAELDVHQPRHGLVRRRRRGNRCRPCTKEEAQLPTPTMPTRIWERGHHASSTRCGRAHASRSADKRRAPRIAARTGAARSRARTTRWWPPARLPGRPWAPSRAASRRAADVGAAAPRVVHRQRPADDPGGGPGHGAATRSTRSPTVSSLGLPRLTGPSGGVSHAHQPRSGRRRGRRRSRRSGSARRRRRR